MTPWNICAKSKGKNIAVLAHKVTTMSDGANFTFIIVSIRRYIKMASQDIASLLSGIVDDKESYKRD